MLSVFLLACGSDAEPDGTAGQSGGGAGAAADGSGGGCTMNLSCTLSPPASSGDVHQDCVDRINQFRMQCACLPALERWSAGESCADRMAMSDSTTGKAHGGFSGRICSPGGNGQNECPSYPSEQVVLQSCLQQMWNEGPPAQAPCEGSCFQQHGHFINMTNAQWKRVACGFHRTADGKVWSVQNFAP
ncbi:MAG TPA: CAP domain-containing protein [Polyangiales bacterium]|nr:CAP domain-containing protein [Polyangiales bacterium]